jgi:hypothetical protein
MERMPAFVIESPVAAGAGAFGMLCLEPATYIKDPRNATRKVEIFPPLIVMKY